MKLLHCFFLFFAMLTISNCYSQLNYQGINIQGQFKTIFQNVDSVNLTIEIIDQSDAIVWKEKHSNIKLSEQKSFSIVMGDGIFITGTQLQFENIDWQFINKVNLYHNTNSTELLIGSYLLKSVPFALHSLHTNEPLSVINLTNTPNYQPINNKVLKFNGNDFYYGNDSAFVDTANFTYYSDTINFADTVQTSINTFFSDTSNFTFFTDSANYSISSSNSNYSNNSNYSLTSNIAYFALSNWSLQGNNINATMFLGSTSNDSLILKANNQELLKLFNTNVTNTNNINGVSFYTNNGFLFNNPNSLNSLNTINSTHFYFNPVHKSIHIGNSVSGLDTLSGDYSFAFGNNVGTNGNYSTVFGYNTYGDSMVYGTTPYSANSSFAFGKNCKVARITVAIGENATADYYRNVAIGKNVTAGSFNATIAIGNNVTSTGAISWAIGHNLIVNSHFSTALGTNASSNSFTGGFIYGDASSNNFVNNTQNNQFTVRADSGFIFYTTSDLTMGVSLNHGDGSWNMISDKNKKQNIKPLNEIYLLNAIDNLPVYSWKYKNQNTKHIGPMAQDFNTIFKLGELPNYINMVDIDGVVLFGIKSINNQMETQIKEEEIKTITTAIDQEKIALEKLELQIKELYEKLDH